MNHACKSAKKCEICGFEVKGAGSIRHHVVNVHKIPIAEYRTKYNVPKLTTAKFANMQTKVTCCICGAERMRPTHLVEAYKVRGITDHTCGKPECAKQLRAIKVKLARSTPESKANTSAASIKSWSKNHDVHAAACQAGMQASPLYAPELRCAKAEETKRLNRIENPTKYSDAIRTSWDARGRSEHVVITFACDQCHTSVTRDMVPAYYHQSFLSRKHHFCNGTCQRIYNSCHSGFRDTKPERIVAAFLSASSIVFTSQKLIHFKDAVRPQRWTVADFIIGDKLLIYVDGCYYHSCPLCGFSGPKVGMVERDAAITQALTALGYTVLRIWEHELKSSAWQSRLTEALK